MNIEIPIKIQSDEKGYFDRECPNENCQYTFKILLDDWINRVSDEEVHCPMCGHVDSSDKWWTQKQIAEQNKIATDWAQNYLVDQFNKTFKKLADSTRGNKFVKISYKPARRISFRNNPIGQCEEWENEITCEKCNTRYSVIGSAFFCPCCGHNSAVKSFDSSMDHLSKMLDSIPNIKATVEQSQGKDFSADMNRALLEDAISNLVSAFQKYACCRYEALAGKKGRVNDFQIVDKGSQMFSAITGKGYSVWLSISELESLKQMFQRRHLIEHNNGLVDQQYIDKSGDTSYQIGQRLVIHESEVRLYIEIIKKLAAGLTAIS